jgi:hypothetical protein
MSDLTEVEIYTRMIESIRAAAGCAQQLAHMRKDARWLKVRDAFEAAITRMTALATKRNAA